MYISYSLILLFLINIIGNDASIKDKFKKEILQMYEHAVIEEVHYADRDVTSDQVTYHLFTKDDPLREIQINFTKPECKLNEGKTIFLLHGWTESRQKKWYEDLKNALLSLDENYNVVQVDWHEPADESYPMAVHKMHDVGNFISEFIRKLVINCNVDLDDIVLIGHSLGGQLAGYVGKDIQRIAHRKLRKVIALDPAGPIFSVRPKARRLNADDAESVVVIHTNGGTFGFEKPCGTIDFFPNGGKSQKGCMSVTNVVLEGLDELVLCSHHRSHQYFIEAIANSGSFMAKSCYDWENFENHKCDDNEAVSMGDFMTDQKGSFFLETNQDSPFSLR